MGKVVVFVGDGGQVRNDVLDFSAFVELCAADESIRHPFAHEDFFKCSGLRVGSIEHGDIPIRHSAVVEGRDFVRHKLCFVVLGDTGETGNRLTSPAIAKELLRHRRVEVVADNRIRRVKNVLC
ncbi:unannotated protein [freshwater metagenome]|uniref:Unannotated protein n=1 Tax=freshwater metagenome TaxID=449393 RepID=A0A6J6G5R5_9ZZZZ